MLLMYLASAGGRVRTGLRRISAHSARLALQQFPIEQAPAELEEVIQGTRFDPCTLVIGTNHMYDHLDWLQSLKQFFINVSYHILVATLSRMALF